MPDEDPVKPGDDADLGEPIELTRRARWAAGLAGGLLGLVGSWALLTGTDGAGSVAIFIAALTLLVLAVVGYVPQKIWGNNMGMVLRAKAEGRKQSEADTAATMAELYTRASTETEQKIVQNVVAHLNSQFAPPGNLAYRSAIAFERDGLNLLREVAADLGVEVTMEPGDRAFDAQLSHGGKRVNVEVKYRLTNARLRPFMMSLASSKYPVLLITDDDPVEATQRLLRNNVDSIAVQFMVATPRKHSIAGAVKSLLDM